MRRNLSRYFAKVEDFCILFLYIFSLQIPLFRTTSLLLFVLLPVSFIFRTNVVLYLKEILFDKYIVRLIVLYLVLIYYVVFVTTLQFQCDYTLIKTLLNVVIHLLVAAFIVSLFLYKKRDLKYISDILIGIFLIQSLIEVLAFFSQDILHFVQLFQSAHTIEIASKFSGRRGLALAGTVFFGLSSIFGLIFIFFIKRCLDKKKFSKTDILSSVVLMLGGFFTGRTFFVGVGVAFMYLFVSEFSLKYKIGIVLRWLLFVLLLVCSIIAILPDDLYNKIYKLIWYVFEAVFNYIEGNGLTTTSSDRLFEEMFFSISLPTFFWGDGLYAGANGGYYMDTDSGYMRNILLFGIGGLLITIVIDIFLLWGKSVLRKKQISLFSFFVFVYMTILHVKGETFGYLLGFHCILFFYYIFYIFDKKLNG